MKTIRTPSNIETLLWFHTRATPHPRADAPAVKDAVEEFIQLGAIEPDGDCGSGCYRTTQLGRAWVQALCNVPPPVAVFADESGNILTDWPGGCDL